MAMQQLLAVHERGKPYRLRELTDPVSLRVHPAIAQRIAGEPASRARRTPAYVPRDADEELRRLLRQERFILLVGESTAGKTRTAYEAVRALYPDHHLIAPIDRKSLHACLPVIFEHQRSVLWLDDLERFLGTEGLTASFISRALGATNRGGAIIVATLRTSEHDRYSLRAESELVGNERESWYAARDAIALATTIELRRLWSRSELQQAQMFADDDRIRSALRLADRFGVAEVLAAAPELVNDWSNAWTPGAHPRGAALVAAAVDCRRAGVHEPVSYELLSRLSERYIELRGGAILRPESEEDALEWATSLSNGASSLLMPTRRPNHYIAFDYLIDLPNELGVPDFVWRELLAGASSAEAFNIGESAFYRFRYDIAIEAYRRAVEGHVPRSDVALASAIGEGGDPDTAVRMLAEVMARWADAGAVDAATMFRVRHQYAYYSACAGNLRDSISMFRLLADDQARILGQFHQDTLASRHRHAFYTAEVGENAEAVELLRQLLQDQSDHLGHSHADTLATRHELGYSLGRAGSVERAIEILTELLTDRRRVFGNEDPRTYQTRHVLSRFVGWSGESEIAADMFGQLADDWQLLLGVGHQHVLLASYEQIYFLAQAGRNEEAAELLSELFTTRDSAQNLQGSPERIADDFLDNIVFGWPPHARYPRQEFLSAPIVCAAVLGQENRFVEAIDNRLRQRLASAQP